MKIKNRYLNSILENKDYYFSSISEQTGWSYYSKFEFLKKIFYNLSYNKLFSILKSISNKNKLLIFQLLSGYYRQDNPKIKKICFLFAKGNIFYCDEIVNSDSYQILFNIAFRANESDITNITDPIIKFIVKYRI